VKQPIALDPATRRAWLRAALAMPALTLPAWPAPVHAQGASKGRDRVALLVGNGDYPNGKALPAAKKNVQDVAQVLQQLGFDVESQFDIGAGDFRAALDRLEKRTAGRAVQPIALFYFCGHGIEVQGDNLLLPAGTAESASASQLKAEGVNLQKEVLARLPHVYPGLSIAVIDACRVTLDALSPLKNIDTDAPDGHLIMYATRPGRPALMPNDPTKNSFFTGVFVATLQRLEDEADPLRTTPVYSMLQKVRSDVQNLMLNHPVKQVREAAQDPHILHNIKTDDFYLALAKGDAAAAAPDKAPSATAGAADEGQRWQAVQQAPDPREAAQRARGYITDFPKGPNVITAQVVVDGSERALKALAEPGMPLRPSGLSDVRGSDRARVESGNAARGDKDAAQRIGEWYARGAEGLERNERRSEAWLRYASSLGSGLASKRLVRLYQNQGRVNDAAVYRNRAVEQGEFLEPELAGERK
jgi:hypothetical protein